MLRRCHVWMGAGGVIVFLLTGQYLYWVHDGLQGMADGPRLLYRSMHIYLLFSALMNVLLGCHLQRVDAPLARAFQGVGSAAVLAGPVLLGVSFFVESYNAGLSRPIGSLGVFVAFGGVLLHALAALITRAKRVGGGLPHN